MPQPTAADLLQQVDRILFPEDYGRSFEPWGRPQLEAVAYLLGAAQAYGYIPIKQDQKVG